jgi:ElaA protein
MLTISIKTFDQLNTLELYKVLQLRSAVFVVEQNCVYQDLDDKDQKALHVLGYRNRHLVAYTRIFEPGAYFNEASIGRVVVKLSDRNKNYGCDIMLASVEAVKTRFKTSSIRISAQTYLTNFYNNLGFKADGGEYLEDGIPHINMVYS